VIKKTFSTLVKIIDYVEAYFLREKVETGSENVRCRYPAYEAADLVLKHVNYFQNHVESVHGVRRQEQRHV
jgi:hypothetical protein